MALPLLLYSSDLKSWLKTSRSTLLSFGLCIISGLIATFIATYIFRNRLDNVWQLSGMLTGIYTGGTANLFAVGLAIDAPQADALLLNAAEVFWGAVYLVFLLSVAKPFWNKFLPKFKGDNTGAELNLQQNVSLSLIDVLKAISLTVVIILIAIGLSFLLFHSLASNFIVITVTTLGILASLHPTVRGWNGTYEAGDYMLLMFGLSIGMMSDFKVLLANGGLFIAFNGIVLLITILGHALLCRWKKIDTDTFLITSTAALYGPVFIGQVASAMKNRSVIIGGIAVSLIGLAIGTYLGIGVAYLVKALY